MPGRVLFDLTSEGGVKSVIIVRLFALGDIVLSLPLVRAMRESLPDAWIGYLVGERYAEALAGVTELNRVFTLPPSLSGQIKTVRQIRKAAPEVAIDLLSSPRSAMLTRLCAARTRIGMDTGRRNGYYHIVLPRTIVRDGRRIKCYSLDANLELGRMLGVSDGSRSCSGAESGAGDSSYGTGIGDMPYGFPAAGEASDEILAVLDDIAGGSERGIAGIAAGATYPSKSWPQERFAELGRRISEEGLKPVVIWGPGEEEEARRLAGAIPGSVLPPPAGIADLGALISRLDILIGIDSGPKHIAVLLGIPTVTLFGPTDPRIWDPMNGLHKAVSRYAICAEGCRERDCCLKTCMEDISVDEVMTEVRSLVGGLGEGKSVGGGE